MNCIHPICLQDPNSGAVMPVPCGRCMPCRVNRTQEWSIRIMHEAKLHSSSIFVTLTYSPEFLPEYGSISKRHLQLFLKRLRKYKNLRYYACGEYGENYGRPHYHLILFGLFATDKALLEKCWPMGSIFVGTLTTKSARYCAKYLQKTLYGVESTKYTDLCINREFSLMSRRPGLGFSTSLLYIDNWLTRGYVIVDGSKRPIPRAYITRLSAGEKTALHELRSKNRIEVIKNAYIESGLDVHSQYDKSLLERSQKMRNLKARMALKQKSKL